MYLHICKYTDCLPIASGFWESDLREAVCRGRKIFVEYLFIYFAWPWARSLTTLSGWAVWVLPVAPFKLFLLSSSYGSLRPWLN